MTEEWGEDAAGMLIVAGYVRMPAENVAGLVSAAAEMMAATQAEDGCLEYTFAEVLGDPGCVRIFERWASLEALQAHMATPHMATFQQAMGGAGITAGDVGRYAIARKGPLM